MRFSLIRSFDNRTMGFKLTAVFISVILIPMLLLAYISYEYINSRLIQDAHEKVNMGEKAAWSEYYVRGEQMRYGMLQATSMEEIRQAVKKRDKDYLKKMMARWKQMRTYVDIWAVTDEKGAVIARLNSDYAGDTFYLNNLINTALLNREPIISTEIITKSALKFEGTELNRKMPDQSSRPERNEAQSTAAEKMALTVVTPVLDEHYGAVGAIITSDIINGDDFIPDMVASKIPGLFTTISVNGARVSTNLMDEGGRNIVGTRIPENILAELKTGKGIYGEWSLPGISYISAFEPIKDYKGDVIGSLDVGISKERLWAIQKENQKVIAAITALGLGFSLIAAFISAFRITRPVKHLKEKIVAFASGDLSARVDVSDCAGSKDEIKALSLSFNSMMGEVGRREEEKGRYLREIERKNSEFSALNEELKKTNEELEVAYEETQSQTEELHAINEELKLLNEDLDRKNAELKRANQMISREEEEVKRAKDKLRLIYDSIRDYIILVDYDYDILEVNRHFTETFKVPEALAIGKNIYSMFGIDPPRDCPIKRSIEAMVPVEVEVTSPAGKVLRWHSYPLIDEHEGPRMAVIYVKDITEYRQLMQKLIQSDKLSSLGELVSGVAHELNNPLTGIMCFSELLIDEQLSENIKSKIKKINDASHRCKRIIDNLLTFARWKRPEKTFEDVNNIIRQSVELRGYQLKVDNIDIELDLEEGLPGTMLDENQIQQVFLNLINNARDAIMEKGGGGRLRITTVAEGNKIVAKFEDSGIGMSREIADRIFDPFFTTKGVGKGTGLGLSISYGIINEHGGSISASSAPGNGTAFTVELPVIAAFKKAANAEVSRIVRFKSTAKGLKALLLDDEPMVLELLNETLKGSGFETEEASSGAEAIDKLKGKDYDIIISDIKMPGLDGKGFYRQVREIRPEILKKIIFISGDSVNPETQRFLEETGNHALKKPFTIDELNEIISKLIF